MSKIIPSEKKENIVVVDALEENNSPSRLALCLRPFIIWQKFLTGVDITRPKTTGNQKSSYSISLILYGVCLLFLNCACTGIFNYVYLKQKFQIPVATVKNNGSGLNTGPSSANKNVSMQTAIFVTGWEYIFICGVHLCFFALQSRFKALWKTLMVIENEFKLGPFTYGCVRQSLWIGFVIILLHSAAFMLYYYLKTSDTAMIPPAYLSLMIVTECYPATIIILLWILVRITSNLFIVLKSRMKQTLVQQNAIISLNELRLWKLHHGLIILLIKRINHCFGIINLLIMIRTFVTFIYNVYEFVGCLMDFSISPYFYIYKFFLQAILPCYLIYSCSQLKGKSSKIANLLHSIDVYSRGGDLEVQNMENGLYLQVIQANANITSGRLFNLDFGLFPTLVGTTLTYVVILVSAG